MLEHEVSLQHRHFLQHLRKRLDVDLERMCVLERAVPVSYQISRKCLFLTLQTDTNTDPLQTILVAVFFLAYMNMTRLT
jgi:hypothetical protein